MTTFLDDDILCSFPYDTSELLFFPPEASLLYLRKFKELRRETYVSQRSLSIQYIPLGPGWEGAMLYCVSFPPVLYCSRSLSQLLADIQKGFFSPPKSLNHNLNHTALHCCACSTSSLGPLILKQSLVPDLNDIHNTVDLYPK